MRAAILAAASAVALLSASCNVNEYCLNCAKGGDGGVGDASDGGGDDGGPPGDGNDGGICVPSGVEVCDGIDNDCNGQIDDNIAGIGDLCDNQVGECAGGVHQCINGVPKCSRAPSPEICDDKDNDCNGLKDEGDPGGGARCGTDVGECVAGTNHCVGGAVQCVGAVGTVGGQPEQCNGRDDDCDGNFDEGIGALGSCGVSNQGACHFGTLQCMGGGTVCVGDQGPTFETCNNVDDDCNGTVDDGFNLGADPQNCGSCNHVCMLAHANAGCAGGNCTVASCATNYYNNDGVASNGCEYGPCQLQGPVEACNGVDDNCNGFVDDNLGAPPAICATQGACAGTVATCDGVGGWTCHYPTTVSVDLNGNIIPETTCDGIDNDCDGRVDEGQPNLGQACHDNGQGACQGTGTYVCDAGNPDGPAKCNITTMGASPTAESCDGVDNDCDGVVDNGAATGNLPGQEWVTIPGSATQIMKYEAARQDASATGVGTKQQYACSKQNVLPWTSVTYPQARAACTAIGARLCTETEWQNMCAQPPVPVYPLDGPVATTDFVFVEAEQASTNATVAGKTWTSVPTQNYSGSTSLQALPDTSSLPSAASAPTSSARLDFRMNLQGSTGYVVWVRMLGVTGGSGSGNSVYVGLNLTQPGTAVNYILSPPVNGQWTWVPSTQMITPATTGTYFVSVYMRADGTKVDAIAVAKQGTTPPPYSDSIWAYQNNPKISAPTTCNVNEYDTNPGLAGDQDDILTTGKLPSCFANGGATARAFDMTGNVKEWTAARAAGQNPIRGGASDNDEIGSTCTLNFTLANDSFFFPNVGFRCCR